MNQAVWVLPLTGLVVYACTGTETQNPNSPLKAFYDSGCKKETANLTTESTSSTRNMDAFAQLLGSTNYGTETVGLKCFAWETSDSGQLKLDLHNFESACGAKWSGTAVSAESGSLALAVENPECAIARCGTCIYDWSFDVSGIDRTKPLDVTFTIDVCPGEQDVKAYTVRLPLDERNTGILCNYANFNALGWQAAALSECGTLGMPCDGTSMCTGTASSMDPTCLDDSVCSDNGNPDERVCVKSCTNNEDCGSHDVLTCKEGLCRPKTTF